MQSKIFGEANLFRFRNGSVPPRAGSFRHLDAAVIAGLCAANEAGWDETTQGVAAKNRISIV
jgi:hypothetical protein